MEIQLDICKLERQQARYEARGRLSPSLICPQSSVVCLLNASKPTTNTNYKFGNKHNKPLQCGDGIVSNVSIRSGRKRNATS
ncbi:hypothetical protein ACLK3S_17070, partial [Leptospira borgpetersenii]